MSYDKFDALLNPDTWLFVILGSGLVTFFLYFQTPEYKEMDLIDVEGCLNSYKYYDNSYSRIPSGATITLKKSKVKYAITEENNLRFFRKKKFEESVRVGDSLTLSVPKDLLLNKSSKIPAYEIKKGKSFYLNKKDSLSGNQSTREFYFWGGLTISLIGICWLIIRFAF
ncbi:MAG: hypothetical protein ACOVQG_05565 [Crocinitomicaceae bacterium]|jgi:hypothetical protein